jgi:regulatory protein
VTQAANGSSGESRDRPACRRRAMDLLAWREHSRFELERKLATKSFEVDVVAVVLDELESDGLLSSERFARSFVNSRASRGYGPYRIRRELADRGVSSGDDYLNDGSHDWARLAREVRVRKFGPEAPADLKEKSKQVRFLEYRGFGQDEIRRALESDGD